MTRCRRSFFGAVVGALAGLLCLPRKTPAAAIPHAGHHCPRCGTTVTTIYCWGPLPGTHTHRHGPTFWYHRG